jgi:hypothetical protein
MGLGASCKYHQEHPLRNIWSAAASERDAALKLAGATESTKAPSPLRSSGALHMVVHPRCARWSLISYDVPLALVAQPKVVPYVPK